MATDNAVWPLANAPVATTQYVRNMSAGSAECPLANAPVSAERRKMQAEHRLHHLYQYLCPYFCNTVSVFFSSSGKPVIREIQYLIHVFGIASVAVITRHLVVGEGIKLLHVGIVDRAVHL